MTESTETFCISEVVITRIRIGVSPLWSRLSRCLLSYCDRNIRIEWGPFDLSSRRLTQFMKSTIYWHKTPCSKFKVNRRFGCTYSLHLHGQRIRQAKNQHKSRWQTEQRRYVPPKRLLTFNWLHGVIHQKIVLFITTAVRTSNPRTHFMSYPKNTMTVTLQAKI
jgi:hypothetical protein